MALLVQAAGQGFVAFISLHPHLEGRTLLLVPVLPVVHRRLRLLLIALALALTRLSTLLQVLLHLSNSILLEHAPLQALTMKLTFCRTDWVPRKVIQSLG